MDGRLLFLLGGRAEDCRRQAAFGFDMAAAFDILQNCQVAEQVDILIGPSDPRLGDLIRLHLS
ncbi:Uncharacterised protein [uncultured Blautia sp.]|nr:Uncharacterised protein [uncultured Blautia sp.]